MLDTNVLIADPEAPGRFQEHDVAIPLTVVEELDKLKTRPDETGASARRAIRTLERLRQQGNLSEGVALPGELVEQVVALGAGHQFGDGAQGPHDGERAGQHPGDGDGDPPAGRGTCGCG